MLFDSLAASRVSIFSMCLAVYVGTLGYYSSSTGYMFPQQLSVPGFRSFLVDCLCLSCLLHVSKMSSGSVCHWEVGKNVVCCYGKLNFGNPFSKWRFLYFSLNLCRPVTSIPQNVLSCVFCVLGVRVSWCVPPIIWWLSF